jgi:carbonic anhydrase
MSEALERLKNGIRKFRAEHYAENEDTYRHAAANQQKPYALIIACADSRVDVETLTSSGPGEVFVTRNIGNMVPAHGQMKGSTTAVIEYAVTALGVQHVVICGHSDCGAMKALIHPDSTHGMPAVENWLSNGQAAFDVASSIHKDDGRDLLAVLTEQNVLMQLAHLKTHPSIAGAMARGKLTVSGWVYNIGSGEVRVAEGESRRFEGIG